jgi:chemotaxis signal transduction protein
VNAQRAQGIVCGGLRVALPYSWARSVVDTFELSHVPGAPPWLAGAANVDGRIVAVVDLSAWSSGGDGHSLRPHGQAARLLLGGDGADTLALRFEGLPALLQITAGATPGQAGLPDRLLPYIQGAAQAEHGPSEHWPVLDMPSLTRTWAQQLAS